MHEMAITRELLGLAQKHAAAAGGRRVTDLAIVVGELSTFSEDAVAFCWEVLAQGSPCEGARLHFRRVPAELTCLDCGKAHTLGGELAPCPACGSSRLKVTAGDDLILESLEIETGPEPALKPAL
jgi:hydrogenase nickel incorporation protein HypA/HybF